MSAERHIAVLVGSLRRESFTRKVANVLVKIAPSSMKLEIVEIGQLPFYNPDVDESGAPEAWTAFRRRIKTADAVLFLTPEYNRSVPAALKNALDVGSRPAGKNAWDGKPAAVVGVSPGAIGGFGANHHLRQSLVYLNMPTLQQPEAYVGNVAKLLDDKGDLTSDETRKFLLDFLRAFDGWIGAVGNQPFAKAS